MREVPHLHPHNEPGLFVRIAVSRFLLIGFGIAGLILQTLNNLTSGKFFLLFSPIFMMYVRLTQPGRPALPRRGVQLRLPHQALQLPQVLPRPRRLQPLVLRALASMASTVFYFFSCGNSNDIVGWIAAILIFALGVFYIGIHFCGGEEFKGPEESSSKAMKEELSA